MKPTIVRGLLYNSIDFDSLQFSYLSIGGKDSGRLFSRLTKKSSSIAYFGDEQVKTREDYLVLLALLRLAPWHVSRKSASCPSTPR